MATITDVSIAGRILESLARPPRAPPLAPANQNAPGFQAPGAPLSHPVVGDAALESAGTQAQDDPDFEFDQTPNFDRLGGSVELMRRRKGRKLAYERTIPWASGSRAHPDRRERLNSPSGRASLLSSDCRQNHLAESSLRVPGTLQVAAALG